MLRWNKETRTWDEFKYDPIESQLIKYKSANEHGEFYYFPITSRIKMDTACYYAPYIPQYITKKEPDYLTITRDIAESRNEET